MDSPAPIQSQSIHLQEFRVIGGVTKVFPQPTASAILLVSDDQAIAENVLQDLFKGLLPSLRMIQTAKLVEQIGSLNVQLSARAGAPQFCDSKIAPLANGTYKMIFPCLPGAHQASAHLLVAIVQLFNLLKVDAELEQRQDAMKRIQQAVQALLAEAPRGINTMPMLQTAHKMGIPWYRLIGNIYQFGQGRRSYRFDSSISDVTPHLSVQLAQNKFLTSTLLRQQGLPVAQSKLVGSVEDAMQFVQQHGYPVVVKPCDRDRGLGVACKLESPEEIAAAFEAARKHSPHIMIETYVRGEDHRIHVFNGKAYRVRHRVPAQVVGDGKSKLEQLIAQNNANANRTAGTGVIHVDDESLKLISQQKMTLQSIPSKGQIVKLKVIANVSAGGTSYEVPLDEVHPDNIYLAERAVATLKLDLAAVDLLIPDIRQSWLDSGAAICEVNSKPQFGADAPAKIFAQLFPQRGKIPVIVFFAGTNSHEWLGAVQHQAIQRGINLGIAHHGAAWIGSRRVTQDGQLSAFQIAEILVKDTQVDALLIAADPSLMHNGMSFQEIDLLLVDRDLKEQAEIDLTLFLRSHCKLLLDNLDYANLPKLSAGPQSGTAFEVIPSMLAEEVMNILDEQYPAAKVSK
ncbi:ATP-binding protein [Undibacterium fentianense]|uniref:ATP-grasp domain-containing protein n=1 Tax=Undibacterium fentianense TaxID=2828728 RepID=A0A941ICX5_9BURK|nr:hypothetical protein [Undibacterium fentianense]MBR7800674.1 hypothetical protein [Undibacterium fentianense]